MTDFLSMISDWPTIVQGALGSALFWIALQLLTIAWKLASKPLGGLGQPYQKEALLREWIYRKYTSRSGLVNLTQGYAITFDHVARYMLQGLIFICLALLLAGFSQVTVAIMASAAIYYFFKSLAWLTPSRKWRSDAPPAHWQRVAELESLFFGKPDEDTLDRVRAADAAPQESKPA